MSRILIEVDEKVAEAYWNASEEERNRLNSLANGTLKKVLNDVTSDKYQMFLDNIANTAQENGLTPEVLNGLLNDNG